MTYNGDHMSMYAINSGLPKTWVRMLVGHYQNIYPSIKQTLQAILDAPVTPELLENQDSEEAIGRYDINDFMLYHHLVQGADEVKMNFLLHHAYHLTVEESNDYVTRFFKRFYASQFKRQTMPEGPKLLNFSLSPRGEYRLPSDIKKTMSKKVIVGLSGGVDSAVAAYLLKKDGYEVHAIFMQNWDNATNHDVLGNPYKDQDICEQEQDYQDAVEVARILDIPIDRVDFIDAYWDRVFSHF